MTKIQGSQKKQETYKVKKLQDKNRQVLRGMYQRQTKFNVKGNQRNQQNVKNQLTRTEIRFLETQK